MSIVMNASLATQVKDHPAYHPGLEGVIAGESALCLVDEGEAGLLYRGYPIRDLAEHSMFEEIAYLLLFGHLPNQKELTEFSADLVDNAVLPRLLEVFLGAVPSSAHPMDIVRTGVSLLGMADADAADHSHDANVRKSVRLLAQLPLVIATSYRLMNGKPRVRPRENLSVAENLLYLLTGRMEDDQAKAMARVLDVSLTLYAEHEFNASTFAARVTASTMTDLYSAITSAIGALKGPLHGGANEAVAEMFLDIGSRERAEMWVREALAKKHRIMGFGHRVLKKGDARSVIIQRHAESLSRICGDHRWYEIATTVDHVMEQEKGLHPNLDFYTAVAYLLMGIPRVLYTPLFVCSRIAGWCAHVIEQQDHNRLMRPRALYTGPPKREYVPLDRRT
ncbi:MAG TPA: citrate/2-methylcitrate synthase [Nitrospira sp.]|nr:citrate/2-methylcitrate synthase [Nitrospira sp.]